MARHVRLVKANSAPQKKDPVPDHPAHCRACAEMRRAFQVIADEQEEKQAAQRLTKPEK